MRLFIAVDVPRDVRDAVERDVVERLRPVVPGARWTRPDGRHLTLKFLGEVPEERVEEVGHALACAVEDLSSFEVSFDCVGGFPNLRRPRVIWVGVGAGASELAGLAGRVDAALERAGFERESRPFAAHITLARFKVPSLVGELPVTSVPSTAFAVDRIVLFRSQLHPQGARYTALREFAF